MYCMIKYRLFGTSGVRGEITSLLTPELAVKLSIAFSRFLGGSGDIAIGFDSRFSSRALVEACISGAMFSGLNVFYLGLIPTPVLLHVVKEFKLDGAIMVSASHTPPKYCGLIFFKGDTGELSPMESKIIEDLAFSEFSISNVFGSLHYLCDVSSIYVESILRTFNLGSFDDLNLKIVCDIGNSPYASYFNKLFEYLGIDFIPINCHPDGFFPGRGANADLNSLNYASNIVKSGLANFGFGVDGDGDRCLFVDENGVVLSGDIIGALFSREALLKVHGGIIVCPINTSNIILDISSRFNGKVHFTRVGPPEIIEAVRNIDNVVFAFEESGKYIWPENILYGDPGYALVKMLEIILKYGSIHEAIKDFPKYFQFKTSIPCADDYKNKVLSYLRSKLDVFNPKEVIDLDGLKLILDDGWILFRPSGTEDLFRVFVEGFDEHKTLKILDLSVKLVKDAIKILSK